MTESNQSEPIDIKSLFASAGIWLMFALVLVWTGVFNFFNLPSWFVWLACAAIGGVFGFKRWWKSTFSIGAQVLSFFVLIVASPIIDLTLGEYVEISPPEKVDAIVVLTGDVRTDGLMGLTTLMRSLKAAELANEGWSSHLVWTEIDGHRPTLDQGRLESLMKEQIRFHRVEGVASTRDEAKLAWNFAAKRGWRKVIVVTSPLHSRRASQAFRRIGFEVVSVPCEERMVKLPQPSQKYMDPMDRLKICSSWLREVFATLSYRRKGWI